MSLGERIKALRRRAGLSQEQVAEQVGVSRQAVAKWEAGQSAPSTENLRKLAQVLQVGLEELAGEPAAACGPDQTGLGRSIRTCLRSALSVAGAYLLLLYTGDNGVGVPHASGLDAVMALCIWGAGECSLPGSGAGVWMVRGACRAAGSAGTAVDGLDLLPGLWTWNPAGRMVWRRSISGGSRRGYPGVDDLGRNVSGWAGVRRGGRCPGSARDGAALPGRVALGADLSDSRPGCGAPDLDFLLDVLR